MDSLSTTCSTQSRMVKIHFRWVPKLPKFTITHTHTYTQTNARIHINRCMYSQLCLSWIHWEWRNNFIEKIWLVWGQKQYKTKRTWIEISLRRLFDLCEFDSRVDCSLLLRTYSALLWQKEAGDKIEISCKSAKCVISTDVNGSIMSLPNTHVSLSRTSVYARDFGLEEEHTG